MHTFILKDQFPKESFKIVKLPVQRGDRVIFQNDTEPECEVIVTEVVEQPGMMKRYKIITWKNE